MQLQNNIHAFDLVYMYTYMGTLTDANNTVVDIQRVYESPLIYADGGFNADDFPISRSVPGGTLEISLNGNALAFAFTGDQSTNSTLQTFSNSDLVLSLTSAGVLPEDYDPETGLDADGQPMPDDAWLRTSLELTIKVIFLPFWIASLGLSFQDIKYNQAFDGQAVAPSVPWPPYVYNGTYGSQYISKLGEARYTGIHIETAPTAPNTRYLHGSAAFKGAFQVWETAGLPQNGLPDWATYLVIPSARVYRVLPPVSFNQVVAIADCPVSETSMDRLTARGMNGFMLEDNMFPVWVKDSEVGTVTWNLVGFEKDGYSYSGTMVLSSGECVVTVTRSDLINDPTVITETYSVNTAIYDVPTKGTWEGWDYDRGGCIWTQPPVDGNDGESGYDSYVPYSSGWHDLEGVDIVWSEITPDNVPAEIEQWIIDEEINTSTIHYSLYDGGIVNITEPKEWYFANGVVINPQTSFEQVALPYSPVGYTNWDAGLTSAIDATPDTDPVTDPDEAMLRANQYAKIDGDRSSVILPGEVAAMFNVPVCAHNFARNIVGATVTFKVKSYAKIKDGLGNSSSYGDAVGDWAEASSGYSVKQVSGNTGSRTSGGSSELEMSCVAIGFIDRANQDYVKLVCVGTSTRSTSPDSDGIWNSTRGYSESQDPWSGSMVSYDSSTLYVRLADAVQIPVAESYSLGTIVLTTCQGKTQSRPTEVACFASIYGAMRQVLTESIDVIFIRTYSHYVTDYGPEEPYIEERYSKYGPVDQIVLDGISPSQAAFWTGGELSFEDNSSGVIQIEARSGGGASYYKTENGETQTVGVFTGWDNGGWMYARFDNYDGHVATGFVIANEGGGILRSEPGTTQSGDPVSILKYLYNRLAAYRDQNYNYHVQVVYPPSDWDYHTVSYTTADGHLVEVLFVVTGYEDIGDPDYPSPWDINPAFGTGGMNDSIAWNEDHIFPDKINPDGSSPTSINGWTKFGANEGRSGNDYIYSATVPGKRTLKLTITF